MADDKLDKKQTETEATKNMAVQAAKAYGGPLGTGVNLASKTKLGNAILNKGAEQFNKQNPGAAKLASALNKGNSDLINNSKSTNETTSESGASSLNSSKESSPLNPLSDSNDTESNVEASGDFSTVMFDFAKKNWQKLVPIAGGALLLLILFISVYLIVASIGGGVVEFFGKMGDAIIGFFDTTEEEAAQKYYDKLEEVQSNRQTTKNVCIDVNLITATLTVDLDASEYVKHAEEDAPDDEEYLLEDTEDPAYYDDENKIVKEYDRMTKEVELLANMQIKTVKYGYDKLLHDDCLPRDTEEPPETETVKEENNDNFNPKGLNWWNSINIAGDFTSDNPELVAMHDKSGFAAFFSKKVNEETNYEFTFYRPRYQLECVKSDSNGNCLQEAEVCHRDLPEDQYQLSIGDLNTMEQSVYYWNLVNSFIPNYYDEYLPEAEGEERDKAIKEIAERIYLLYNDLGPSTNCVTTQEYICRNDEGSNYYAGTTENNNVPVSGSRSEFFTKISDIAISEMSRTGIMSSVTMAQAALESGYGTSGLSSRYSNYYGISAGSCVTLDPYENKGRVLKPGEAGNNCSGNAYWDGTAVSLCSERSCKWRRVYDNFANSTRDHSRLLTTSTYQGCNSYKNAQDQIQCIKDHGYAEDSEYVSKVMSLIKSYNLTQYDIGVFAGGDVSEPTSPLYSSNICVHAGDANIEIGDWRNWKQCNTEWGSKKIGTQTICKVGCAATSVTILLAKSGTYTTLGAGLNPGTFVQAHRNHGGFYGDNIKWDVTDVAPNFRLVGRYFGGITVEQVANYVNSGKHYVILNVKHGGHFVAVDYVSGGAIHIIDPGYNRTVVPSDYSLSEIAGYVVYRKDD